MELSQAFGQFFPSPVEEIEQPPAPVPVPAPIVKTVKKVQKSPKKEKLGTRTYLGSRSFLGSQSEMIPEDPRFYLINIQIAQDDCHLVCVFLLVLILSVLLTKK